jgi:hypothetical protein
MKPVLPALALVASALAGCAQNQYALDPQMSAAYRDQREFDTYAVESVQDAAIKNAILEQHALFPYHFVPGSVTLTEVGQRDLSFLTDNYKTNPGPLALIKGDTPNELYALRKEAIAAALQQAGLPSIAITDGPVGGRGMTGQAAVIARREKQDDYSGAQNTDTGSITDTGAVTPTGDTE